MTVAIGTVVPGMFDGWMLAGIAVLEHRHLEKVEARRLPF